MKKSFIKIAALGAMAMSFNAFGQCDNANLSAWTDVRDDAGTQVNVIAGGLEGSACSATFQSTADNSQRGRLQDRTPACEASYRAAFYFEVDALGTLASNERTKFFNAQCNVNDNGGSCTRVGIFQFRLQGDGNGNNILRSFVIDENQPNPDGRRKFDLPVAAGTNTIEVQWTQASSDGASDGTWRVWVNNTTEASPDIEYTDVNNGGQCLDQVGLGLIQPTVAYTVSKSGIPFTVDAFESRRQTGVLVQ